jgi:molecular chaperone DnaK (HSP70)
LEPRYVIGIDLGTTNSALAYAEVTANADPFAPANVQLLPVPQLENPGEVRDEDLLPSFLYLPGASDFPAGTIAVPWDPERNYVVGRLAQKRGVENAGRLVSSAKSWLSHSGVDRTSAILPFRAPEGVDRVSPVEASRRYLEHLRQAWDAKFPESPFTSQQVLVTVPASFDAVARELTLEAAQQAGYQNITILEEPQAAFYAWIERHPDWRERVQVGDLILVVDIGGGTTDFSPDRGHRKWG